MTRLVVALVLSLTVGASPAYAATHISTTTYASNTTWTLANSPYVFPDAQFAKKLHNYRVLEGDEIQTWNDIFNPIFLT